MTPHASILATDSIPNLGLYLAALRRRELEHHCRHQALCRELRSKWTELRAVRGSLRRIRGYLRTFAPLCRGGTQ